MIFAIIDLGTNTFNLLIARRMPNHTFDKIFNTKIAVKLGEGSINLGYIADAPFQRGISALKQFQQYILDYNVEREFAFATSAIRTASNGLEFVIEAKNKANISVNVINGDEEAELIYYGNRMAVKMSEAVSLIMDIGGGSTEFILANQSTIYWKQSFLLGAARLLQKFSPSDPISHQEIEEFNTYLKTELNPLFEAVKKYKPTELIGSSGAFDSITDIIAGEFNTQEICDSKTEYPIDINHYKFVSEIIKASTIKERHHIKGLIEMRIDMIVVSFLLVDFIINELSINSIRVSTFSLKEGVINKKLGLNLK